MSLDSLPLAVYTRKHSKLYYLGLAVVGIIIVALSGILIWMLLPSRATAESLEELSGLSDVTTSQTADAYELNTRQDDQTQLGIIFYPGAHVASDAYLAKLAGIAGRGVQVYVVKSPLHFAIFDSQAARRIIKRHPTIHRWYIGGHSLGGVTACIYAKDHPDQVAGLFFFGSFCAGDISKATFAVLSLSGSEDGLSTPVKIEQAKHLNPPTTRYLEIPGANHADFGDYGDQAGDKPSTTTRLEVKQAITDALIGFIQPPLYTR